MSQIYLHAFKIINRPHHFLSQIFYKGDILEVGLLESIFKNNDIKTIVNFAAETHVDHSILNPGIFFPAIYLL